MSNQFTTTVVGSYTVPDWYPALQEAVMAGKLAPEAFYDAKTVAARAAIDVQTHRVETPEEVAQTIQRVAAVVGPEHLWVNPDCGLNHLPRDVAFAKLRAMVAGTQIAKQQLVRS